MTSSTTQQEPITFTPNLASGDPLAVHWIRQVTIRLRREMTWNLYETGILPGSGITNLPQFPDRATASLGMCRYWQDKMDFFQSDPTASYLTQLIETIPPVPEQEAVKGSFSWLINELELDDTATFVLALALAATFDNAMGSVVAACLNDHSRTRPNLSLAQQLWDRPDDVLTLMDPGHNLYKSGVLFHETNSLTRNTGSWDSPIMIHSMVANSLLHPGSPLPEILRPITLSGSPDIQKGTDAIGVDQIRLITSRLQAVYATRYGTLRVVPVRGPVGSRHSQMVQSISSMTGRTIVRFSGDPRHLQDPFYLNSLACLCWLKGVDLYLDRNVVSSLPGLSISLASFLPFHSIPVTIFISITDRHELEHIPGHLLLPMLDVPAFTYHDRMSLWKEHLGDHIPATSRAIPETARRFRYEKEHIERIAAGLKRLPGPLTEHDLIEACRAEFDLDIGDLARKVEPRFSQDELILPRKYKLQFQEIMTAIRSLTDVHYVWGTARVWNESGISVLFAGPPGTGKTMAAEILATHLNLPMYRIDLSQVVNKYIGETEKNLKKLFDTADISDIILFFDEADALFGRRTDVKDAHDRYANLEISYLLERMERFKGVCILATNRKKDLDEAFLRRLRYIVDFPHPGIPERKRIWEQMVPATVDRSGIDFSFLARQFSLVGGHIRSIVFNACLQSAHDQESLKRVSNTDDPEKNEQLPVGRIRMRDIIVAVKREYDKMNRSISLEHFGQYADIVREMELKDDNN